MVKATMNGLERLRTVQDVARELNVIGFPLSIFPGQLAGHIC